MLLRREEEHRDGDARVAAGHEVAQAHEEGVDPREELVPSGAVGRREHTVHGGIGHRPGRDDEQAPVHHGAPRPAGYTHHADESLAARIADDRLIHT